MQLTACHCLLEQIHLFGDRWCVYQLGLWLVWVCGQAELISVSCFVGHRDIKISAGDPCSSPGRDAMSCSCMLDGRCALLPQCTLDWAVTRHNPHVVFFHHKPFLMVPFIKIISDCFGGCFYSPSSSQAISVPVSRLIPAKVTNLAF